MEKGPSFVLEWKIQNFSHWRAEVHGNSLASPKVTNAYFEDMELFPRGINGEGKHMLVRLCGITSAFTGVLSLLGPEDSVFCTQQVNSVEEMDYLKLPPGPSVEKVLAKIFKKDDQITVSCRIKSFHHLKQHLYTTINVMKISLKPHLNEILKAKPNVFNCIAYIPYSQPEEKEGFDLYTWINEETIQFMMEPRSEIKYTVSVDVCISLLHSDDTIVSQEETSYLFWQNAKWTFSHSLILKELMEKRMTILLGFRIKSKRMINSYIGLICDYSGISIAPNDDISYPTSLKTPESITCTQNEDSVAVLYKDFSSLFNDENFSDLILKSGDVSFPVHRVVLGTRSPVFKRLLTSDMRESATGEVDIADIDPATLARFLSFLYTGTVENLQLQDAFRLYYAAEKYEVLSLKRECADCLLSGLSIMNVCDVLSFADQYQDEELGKWSKNFLLNNLKEVLKSTEWDAFTKSEPLLAVNTLTHFVVEGRIRKHGQ